MRFLNAVGSAISWTAVLFLSLTAGMFLGNQPFPFQWGALSAFYLFSSLALAVSQLLLQTTKFPKVSVFLALLVAIFTGWKLVGMLSQTEHLSHLPLALPAVVGLFILSLALLLAQRRKTSSTLWVQRMALLCFLLGTARLLQHLYGVVLFHQTSKQYPLDLLPAIAMLFISMGLLCLRVETGLFSVLLTGYAGSMMARRFVPLVLGLPVMIGALYKLAHMASPYGPEWGIAIISVISVGLALVLLDRMARRLNKVDHERNQQHDLSEAANRKLAFAIADLEKQNQDLKEAREALTREAIRDPLTGVYNRRYLNGLLAHLLRPRRRKEQFGLLMIDLDHFKRINDTYGHPAGDKALLEVAGALRENLREEDSLCRHGGEEFVAILPGVNQDSLLVRAEMLCRQIAKLRISYHDQKLPSITVSMGAVLVSESKITAEEILSRADQALYHSKESGRNCVTLAEHSHVA